VVDKKVQLIRLCCRHLSVLFQFIYWPTRPAFPLPKLPLAYCASSVFVTHLLVQVLELASDVSKAQVELKKQRKTDTAALAAATTAAAAASSSIAAAVCIFAGVRLNA